MDPAFHKKEILDYPDEDAEKLAMELYISCQLSRDEPDAAFESVSDFEFDAELFDDFIAEYVANESISTNWGKLINYEKEIKMAGNAMSKAAGSGINLLPGTDGFTTSAPRKKDGQYYTRATLAFSDGQVIRILFYDPDKPEEKPKYPTSVVSFQIFLNKKDITASLVRGGGKDYGPMKFGKIIGKLLERNSEKFQKKNAEIRAQKEEMEAIDKEVSSLDEQITSKSSAVKQSQEKNVFLKKQHADLKQKAEAAVAAKKIEESKVETEAGKTWIEGTTKHFVGKKYDPDMTTKDAAKAIREEIKSAQKAGQIIDAGANTYSVTMETFSMGARINVMLKKLPEGVELYSNTWKEFIKSGSSDIPEARLRYSDAVKDTIEKIENIVNQYNKKETSTEPDDYSNVSFYPHVDVDPGFEKSEREKVESEVDTEGEVETTEPRDELKRLLTEEIKQLKADPDAPEFTLGLRVAKKKDGTAGKVSLDLKEADVPTLEALDYLKLAINNRVSAHTDNYELKSDKAAKQVSTPSPEDINIIEDNEGRQYKIEYEAPDREDRQGIYQLKIKEPRGSVFKMSSLSMLSKEGLVNQIEEMIKESGNEVSRYITKDDADLSISPEPEEPQQEQVEGSEVAQAEIPPEEKPAKGRDIGQEFKDREGVTKPVTHDIDGKQVSSIQQGEYFLSAYLRDRAWINLPTEKKTLISEADLKTAIAKSEDAYQVADDILDGNYDAQGHEKVDQLLDEIAEVIQDESKLIEVADYLTDLITKKFTESKAS